MTSPALSIINRAVMVATPSDRLIGNISSLMAVPSTIAVRSAKGSPSGSPVGVAAGEPVGVRRAVVRATGGGWSWAEQPVSAMDDVVTAARANRVWRR